jgi:hypothetical protein
MFTRLYRLSKGDFANLVSEIDPRLSRTHSRPHGCATAVDPRVMTAVTLRYLAGGRILDLGWPYGLGDSTVYAVIDKTIDAIDAALQNIAFPSTTDDAERGADAWQRLRGSPLYGIISALDGIALEIRCQTAADGSNPTSYYNRKGFYASCEQAANLANYGVYFLSTKHSGSSHDSRASGTTSLFAYLLKSEYEGWLPDCATVAAGKATDRLAAVSSPLTLDLWRRYKTLSATFYLPCV